jgi:hypothetical protein
MYRYILVDLELPVLISIILGARELLPNARLNTRPGHDDLLNLGKVAPPSQVSLFNLLPILARP